MAFYNRMEELKQLRTALRRERRQLVVVYGRRRTGKSTLLHRLLGPNDVYFQASQTTSAYQMERFVQVMSAQLPGLAGASFTGWESLLTALNAQVRARFTLVLDELPYLVKADPALPSILQRLVDERDKLNFDLIVCGSSQQMMRGMVLQATAPLYGRADEVIKVGPLSASWLRDHLPGANPDDLVTEYATWGGIPRYWELRADYPDHASAVQQLVLSPTGVLHEEPNRLLLEDLRDIVQSTTILALVASGVHKISKLGGRLGKPATDLSRPLNRLIEMGYLQRESPYGTKPTNKKISLYKVADPFLRFHYRYVYPNLSELIPARIPGVWRRLEPTLTGFTATPWEDLCHRFVATHPHFADRFKVPGRWWGKNTAGKQMKLDLVSESFDGKTLLVGECKWSVLAGRKQERVRVATLEKAKLLPFYRGQAVEAILFCRGGEGAFCFGAGAVLAGVG